MIYAEIKGRRAKAFPGRKAHCPTCRSEVIPKCGDIKTWHWAHKAADCDPWAESTTEWHLEWQARFPKEYVEVTIVKGNERHRADVCLPGGPVIEVQHSAIGVDDIRRREAFYGRMVWIFDARDAYRQDRLSLRRKDNYFTFRWKHPRVSVAYARRPVYLDLGDRGLLYLRKIYPSAPCGGWGYLLSYDLFVERMKG